MKTFYLSSAVAAALVATAGSASAQDFNGPSVGIQGGWQKTEVRNPRTEAGIAPIDRSRDAFVGGVFVGYDREVAPDVVLGVQADFSLAASDTMDRRVGANAVSIDPKYNTDITVRAGYVVAPKTLVYARGGYSNQRIRTTVLEAASTRSASENLDGWTIGGGVERLITDKVSARLEYRYADYGVGDGGRWQRHQTLLGVAYRF